MKLSSNGIFTLLIFIIIGVFTGLAFTYVPESRFAPLVIGIPTLGLVIFQLLVDFSPGLTRRMEAFRQSDLFGIEEKMKDERLELKAEWTEGEQTEREKGAETYSLKEQLKAFIWPIAFVVLSYLLGYLYAVVLFVPLFLKVQARESWTVTILMTVGTWLFVYVLFVAFLDLRLYEGILFK